MKKLTHFAARLLLHLTLFFAFVGGADKLSAQTGTWYFTGLENSFAGSSSSPPRHIEDKLTISQSGDSYTIAYGWDSSATDTWTFGKDTLAPAQVKNTILRHDSIVAVSSKIQNKTHAKLVKIDNDTWTFYISQVTQTKGTYYWNTTATRNISGVLTKAPIPAANSSKWAKKFNIFGIYFSTDYFSEEYSYFGNNAIELRKKNNAYYFYNSTLNSNFYNYDFEYDSDENLSSYSVDTPDGYYEYDENGKCNYYSIYKGDTTYYYEYDSLVFYEVQRGDTTYHYDANGELEHYEALKENVYYFYDADGTLQETEEAGFYTVSGKYLVLDDGDSDYYEKTIIFQLSGNRLAYVTLSADASYPYADSEVFILSEGALSSDSGSSSDSGKAPVEGNKPTITKSSASEVELTAGKSTTFKVTATASGDKNAKQLSYQWYDENGAIPGATKATYTVKTAKNSTQGEGDYYVVVKNSEGSTTSSTFSVSVFVPPYISGQPENKEAVEGNTVSFSVDAGGTGPLYYQWKHDGQNVGSNSSTLTVTASASTVGKYTVIVTNGGGKVTSKAATLKASVRPVITSGLVSTTYLAAGKSAKLSVNATGTKPLKYEWSKDGQVVSTSATYTVKAAKNSNAADGIYTVKVYNAVGSVSESTRVEVIVPAYIAGQPESVNAVAGDNVSFTVTAGGDGPFTYQWKLNGKALSSGSGFSGVNSRTLTVSASKATAGKYTVEVSNDGGKTKVTSKAATLKVLESQSSGSSGNALAPSSLPVGSKISYTTTRTSGGSKTAYSKYFVFEKGGKFSQADILTGTYTYSTTGKNSATFTYSWATGKAVTTSRKENGTVTLTFTGTTVSGNPEGTWTCSGRTTTGTASSVAFTESGSFVLTL